MTDADRILDALTSIDSPLRAAVEGLTPYDRMRAGEIVHAAMRRISQESRAPEPPEEPIDERHALAPVCK